jgi:hypothetical protein
MTVPGPDPTDAQSLRLARISQPSFISSSCHSPRDIVARISIFPDYIDFALQPARRNSDYIVLDIIRNTDITTLVS